MVDQSFVDRVEAEVGMGSVAWDMVLPEKICAAVLNIAKDAIAANLEKLEKLASGSIVRLSTGEEYGVYTETEGDTWVVGPGLQTPVGNALPLLRDAVKGGAVVVLPGEEV